MYTERGVSRDEIKYCLKNYFKKTVSRTHIIGKKEEGEAETK